MSGVNLAEKRALDERRQQVDACAARVLGIATSLVSVRKRWTQGTSARSINGNYLPPTDPGASCWCASGAILSAMSRVTMSDHLYEPVLTEVQARMRFAILEAWPYYEHATSSLGMAMIAGWNDATERTHNEVVRTLRRAGRISLTLC